MVQSFVLKDQDTASFGVNINSVLFPVKKRSCAAFKLRCRIVFNRVVEVEMDSVESLELLARTFSIEIRTIAVSWGSVSYALV
jgi:hypothetical protein